MATGLEIEYKRSFGSVKAIALLVIALLVIGTGYYIYRWYTTGEKLPVPIPVASADPSVSEAEVTPAQVSAYTVPGPNPRYLSIPSLGIKNARVTTVGITKDGQLDTPRNINDVAWYTKSALPGQGSGAVLIDGHSGGFSKDGVFSKLGELPIGAEIVLERGDGKKFTYKVAENKNMSLKEVNKTGMKTMMYSAEDDKEGLNLITCSGNYIPKDKVFDHRIMLRAVQVK